DSSLGNDEHLALTMVHPPTFHSLDKPRMSRPASTWTSYQMSKAIARCSPIAKSHRRFVGRYAIRHMLGRTDNPVGAWRVQDGRVVGVLGFGG
ncbi:MAG: hypothetical protein Q9187_006837, partial [Circinaria calcarea]